jgi:DNA-binding response OmpR family regulator
MMVSCTNNSQPYYQSSNGQPPIMTKQDMKGANPDTILLVMADETKRTNLRRFLSSHGYSILQAATSAEARDILDRDTPSLAIIDVLLSKESGADLLRYIRDRLTGLELPVILLSPFTSQRSIHAACTLGANGYVNYPVSLKLLQVHIAKILRASQSSVHSPFVGRQVDFYVAEQRHTASS